MNRSHSVISAVLAIAISSLFCSSARAQEIYKWTDANGKVHYGDRAAAPESSKKISVKAAPPAPPPAVPTPAAPSQPRAEVKSVPANPALVGPMCKGLIDKIAVVQAGQKWEALYREFDSACPGIAYECVDYQSSPQNNRCSWVIRTGGTVHKRKSYP